MTKPQLCDEEISLPNVVQYLSFQTTETNYETHEKKKLLG